MFANIAYHKGRQAGKGCGWVNMDGLRYLDVFFINAEKTGLKYEQCRFNRFFVSKNTNRTDSGNLMLPESHFSFYYFAFNFRQVYAIEHPPTYKKNKERFT